MPLTRLPRCVSLCSIPHEDSQYKYAMVITIQRFTTFLFGKVLGNASDVHGRKLYICGALMGYAITAVMLFFGLKAVEFVPFLIGGIILGMSAPLAPHAIAAVADISPQESLPRNMAIFQGIGLQLGLVCGCVVALTIIVANDNTDTDISNVDANFNMLSTSFVISCCIGLTGVLIVFFGLKETLHPDSRSLMNWKTANPLAGIAVIFRTRYLLCMGLMVFLMSFGAAASEATFLNWIVTRFSLYKWKRSDSFCPKTYLDLSTTSTFNVSEADEDGSGFRCCSWDATLHGHEWSTADWGSAGAAFMPAGTAAGPLGGAADRGSLLAPTLLREDGVSCMGTPGQYMTCAGFPQAAAAATAEAAPGQSLFNQAYPLRLPASAATCVSTVTTDARDFYACDAVTSLGDTNACSAIMQALAATDAACTYAPATLEGSVYTEAAAAYTADGGTLTSANVATCGGTATDTAATPNCATAFGSAADTTAASCEDGCTYVEGFDEAMAPHITTALTAKITALIKARVPVLFFGFDPSYTSGIKTFGSKCGDPALSDAEVCPELGFPICVPDGVALGKVMTFLLPMLLCGGVGQAIVMSILPKKFGLKKTMGFLMVWSSVTNLIIAFLPTFTSMYIFVGMNSISAAVQPAVVSLFIGQAASDEKGSVAGSYRTIEAGGKALGSFVLGTIYMAAYFREYPAQGLKYGPDGPMNYDSDMNPIGGGLLDNGAMCQPSATLLGALNPYKTGAAATPVAMGSAATFQADAQALAVGPSGVLYTDAAAAYTADGGILTSADAATCGGTATDTAATPNCATAFGSAADTTAESCEDGCTYVEGFDEAMAPHIATAVGAETTALITAEVSRLIGTCKPSSAPDADGVMVGHNQDHAYCRYDFMPDVKDSGSCALAKTYDMFADPEFPGIVLILTAIPNWLMCILYFIMEATPSIKESCAFEIAKEADADAKEDVAP